MAIQRWKPVRSVRPWEPVETLREMQQRLENIFGRELVFPSFWDRLSERDRPWAPPIEMMEKEDRFIVKAELPGVRKEDIDLQLTGDTLNIKGERKAESEVKEENYYCCEHSYGSFFRSITIPSSVDAKKIEASYNDGILEVTLPKAPEAKPKKIEVAVK